MTTPPKQVLQALKEERRYLKKKLRDKRHEKAEVEKQLAETYQKIQNLDRMQRYAAIEDEKNHYTQAVGVHDALATAKQILQEKVNKVKQVLITVDGGSTKLFLKEKVCRK